MPRIDRADGGVEQLSQKAGGIVNHRRIRAQPNDIGYSTAMDDFTDMKLPLLGANDPPPVTIYNAAGAASVLILCDHASNAVPASLDRLGLRDTDLMRHIAYDIGAAEVTRLLADRLDAPALLAGYSRLVIDCNRRPGSADSIAMASDGTVIPGNRNVTPEQAQERAEACFWPYHRRIGAGLAGFALRGIKPAIINIHGFTPTMQGFARPWHVGVLWDRDPRLPAPLLAALSSVDGLVVGDNEPYSGRSRLGYSNEVHATETGLPNVLIELREDTVRDAAGQERMAALLAEALMPVLADPTLYRSERFE